MQGEEKATTNKDLNHLQSHVQMRRNHEHVAFVAARKEAIMLEHAQKG
jgi:hypothetical protein